MTIKLFIILESSIFCNHGALRKKWRTLLKLNYYVDRKLGYLARILNFTNNDF